MADLRLDSAATYSITCYRCQAKGTRSDTADYRAIRWFKHQGWTSEREVFEGWHVVRLEDDCCNSIVFDTREDTLQLCPSCSVVAGRGSSGRLGASQGRLNEGLSHEQGAESRG